MAARLKMQWEYQQCRGLGHSWEPFIPPQGHKRPAPWGQRLSLRCVRCGMERYDVFTVWGELSTRDYDPPKDYRLTADEVPSRDELRLSLAAEMHEREKEARNGSSGRKSPRPAARKRNLRAVS